MNYWILCYILLGRGIMSYWALDHTLPGLYHILSSMRYKAVAYVLPDLGL